MSYVIKGYGAMHKVNTRLHRPSVMPDECAEEGGIPHGHWRENQGDPIQKVPRELKVPRPIKTVEQEFPLMWLAYCLVVVLTVGISALMVSLA